MKYLCYSDFHEKHFITQSHKLLPTPNFTRKALCIRPCMHMRLCAHVCACMCPCIHVCLHECAASLQTVHVVLLSHLCRLDGSGALQITVTAHSSLKAVVQLQGCLAGGSPLMATLPSAGKAGAVPLQRVPGMEGLPRGGVFTALPTDAMGWSTLLIHPGTLKAGVYLTVHCK